MKYIDDGVSATLAVQRKDGGFDTVICRNGGDDIGRLLNCYHKSARRANELISLGELEAVGARSEVAAHRDGGEEWYYTKPTSLPDVRALFRRLRFDNSTETLHIYMPNSRGKYWWRMLDSGDYHLFTRDDDPNIITDDDGV